MIVPSMTFPEICNELKNDQFDIALKVLVLYKQFEKLVLKSSRYPVIRTYDFITRERKNTCYVTFKARKRSHRRNPYVAIYAVFNRPEGKYAVSQATDFTDFIIYPPHFFKRYRERIVKNDSISNTALIRLFFKNDWGYSATIVDENFEEAYHHFEEFNPDNKISFVAATSNGYCFGESQGPVSILKTIISEDMLFEQQKKIFKALKSSFDESIRNSVGSVLYP